MSVLEKAEGACSWSGEAPSNEDGITNAITELSIRDMKKNRNSEASKFLNFVVGDESVTFQTLDDSKKGDGQLINIFHGSLSQHLLSLTELNQKGAGIFFTVNATDQRGRATSNITRVRALFVDLDGAPIEPVLSGPLRPHAVIQTSPGRFHVYWLVKDVNLEHFSMLQKTLIRRFNADPSVHDLPRVMRLPGFYHRKADPFLVSVIEYWESDPYSFEDLQRAFSIEQSDIKKQEARTGVQHDIVLQTLEVRGMLGKPIPGRHGAWEVLCPNREAHTTGDQGAVYFEAHTNGYQHAVFKCQHAHCADHGIDYLKNRLGLDEEWTDPVELRGELLPVASFKAEMLPDVVRPWLIDVCERMQVPIDFLGASCMVVMGSLIGRRIGLYPKALDDWLVVPNLWGAVVGRPSLLKSPAIAEIMKPFDELTLTAVDKHRVEMGKYEQEEMWVQARMSAIKDEMKKAAKRDVGAVMPSFDRVPVISKPEPKRYKTEDGTTEKIGELLQGNPQGLLIHRDELVGWLKSLDKYGREGDRAFYLESWNGMGSYTVDRIGRGTLHIPALCLSIIGGIQPGPLSAYVHQATSCGEGDDGLLQRFQLLVWPDAPQTWVNVDRAPDPVAREMVYEVFRNIDAFEPFEPSSSHGLEMQILRFDTLAQEKFDVWRSSLEQRLRTGELAPFLESHLAKFRSLMPKLALILYVVETVGKGVRPKAVDLLSVTRSIQWCEYLETHARRLYASGQNPSMEAARALLNHIVNGDLSDGFSLRDVYHARHWSRLETAEQVSAAVKLLEDLGWVKSECVKTQGRPSTRVCIHPRAQEFASRRKEGNPFSERVLV